MPEKPVKTAEYNMGALDYERLGMFITTASQAVLILLNDIMIQEDPSRILFATGAVYTVYSELRRFAYENSDIRKRFDEEFEEVFQLALNEVNDNKAVIMGIRTMQRPESDICMVDCPWDLYKRIRDLYNKVLSLKHEFGFDVPTKEKRDLSKGFKEMEDLKWKSKDISTSS
ncbi:MAG: hypothetical protein Sv326_0451 [Candidatus Fermentimicrarchaeum limneticum]|uniref:Uncharacterized protein n=1 Tax=Fermentimicrarchaeum limneticum TaxID=2795018 RepID=A0A7D5XL87_FERL1|nr:MAG: hypothetical protein Sv326_0377 [Candidatus Fermentimicrarchaeum limneticum]QLJ52589.1 MAG: hypothetical protein Sv326_0414 [Candidatus Fermentimicrarchaeum limneticum]QLJ52626.1 MAG: hypothetical protein Sv326_0451 [Candidatus Fermentimicrarchaeum limneticum]